MRRVGRVALLGGPVLWIAFANIAPLLDMLRISLLDHYPPLAGQGSFITLDAYTIIFTERAYRVALLRSLAFAALTTLVSLLLCYPLAYHIVRHVPPARRGRRLMLLVAPFWTSEIVRIFAITLLLGNRGAINLVLRWAGLVDDPVPMLYGGVSLAFGMLTIALLSMLLPLYAALDRLPAELLDAARDLGAGGVRRLLHVTLPLTAGGIAAGSALVFLLSLGAFAVPVLLGGPDTTLLAVTIGGFFGSAANRWPLGAAFGIVVLVIGGAVAGSIIGLSRARPAR